MIIHVDGSTTNKQFVYRTFNFRTRWCRGLLAAALVRAWLLASCVNAAMGQGCEDRDFRCVDPTHYAVCLPKELRSQGWTADPEVSCPEGTFCDERSPARCSPQPQSLYSNVLRRLTRSLDHSSERRGSADGECPGAGRFAVSGSCDSLLVCIPGLDGLRARRASCAPGDAFDRVSRRCVARRLLSRDPRNAECLQEEKKDAPGRRKRSAEPPMSVEVAQEGLQKRVPQPQPQPQQQPAQRSLAAAIYVAPNVTEISPAGPYGRCREGETWDASLGQCMLTDERSIGPAFHCDGRGVFPDRGNPNAYISCDPLITGEGFVAHRYWCPITMHFDPIARVCRTYSSKGQRSPVKLRRRTNTLPRPQGGSMNDEASNPDEVAEGDWNQEEETEERVRSQRELYSPGSSQSSDTDGESFNDENGNGQIERSDTKQITDAVRNRKEVPAQSQEKRVAKNSVDDWTKMVPHEEANADAENEKDVLKRDDSGMEERHQLVPSAYNSGGSEEQNIAGDAKSADTVRDKITLNQGYFSVNNEEQGFQGDSEQANANFEIQNEAQQHGQMKRVAENAEAGWSNKVAAAETNTGLTGEKNVLKRDELEQNRRLTSSEDTGESKDAERLTGGQILSEPVQNRFTNNAVYADMNSNELSFNRDSDRVDAAFESQNAAQNQMSDLGEISMADWTNKISPLESESAVDGSLDMLKRGEVEQNQLDSNAYSIEGGEEDGLQGNAGVEDIEKAANSEFGQVRVDSRDLRQTQSDDQVKREEEKSIADWSNEVPADDGATVEKKMLKRDEIEHAHKQVSSSDIGEDNEVDELQGYVDVSSNGQAIVDDSEQLSGASQNQNEAGSSSQMTRIVKSSSADSLNKDDASIDEKEVLKRDDSERSEGMFSSVDTSDDDPAVREDELSDTGDLDEGLVYNKLQESLPLYHRPGRRDNDAETNVASDTSKGELRDSWSKEELVGKKDTSNAVGSGGDSRRSLSLSGNGLRPSEDGRSTDGVSQNEAEQKNNDVGTSAEASGQHYEGDRLTKGSHNEHSKFVEREVSSNSGQETSLSDEKRNTGGSQEAHDKFLEEQNEIIRQLSSMKQRSAVNKERDNAEAMKERQERSESSREKQSHHQGNRHIILLKPHEDNIPVGERANEQVNSPNLGDLALSASLQTKARSPKQLSGDKGKAEREHTAGHSKERASARKEKLSVVRRQHSDKEIKGHLKREENYRNINSGVEKRESRPFSRNAESSDSDKHKKQPKNVREGQHKSEPVVNIEQIIKEAERLAKIKATPRKPVTEYLEKQKRHTGARAVSQTSVSDPKRAGKNEGKEGRGKSSREAVGTKQAGTLNPAPRVAGSVSEKADKRGDTKASGKVVREVMENIETNNLNSGGFERDDRRPDNQASAKGSYENNRKSSDSSLTPVIEEIISNSVNKYSKFPPVNIHEHEKSESKSAVKDREIAQPVRQINGYEEDPNVALQGKSGSAHDHPKTEKKGMNRDTKKHEGHRAASSKEGGFYQSGYISIGPMNKLARFQRNGGNMIYDVTSLSDSKNRDEEEPAGHDSQYATNSRRRAVDSTQDDTDAAVPEEAIGMRTLLSTKHSDNEPDAKYAPSSPNRSAKEITDHKERKDTKTEADKQVKEARFESRDVSPTKTEVAGNLQSLSSFDNNNNKIAEEPLQKAAIADKGASKRTATGEGPSKLEKEATYEKTSDNAPSAGETRSSRRIVDIRGDAPLMTALRMSVAETPFKDAESPASAFECPAGGSYPYREDDKAYYACVPTTDGSGFVATIRSCSENEVFDPITRSCTSRDIMPSREYKSSQLPQSGPVIARSPADEPLENPCTAEGRISNPYDCSAFYLCLPKRSGPSSGPDFFHIALHCPKGSIFDTESRQCVEGSPTTCIPEYKLLDKLRRRRGRLRSQSASAGSRAARTPEEACPRPGRFARADGGCADYVLCARPGGVGPLLAVPVRCPAGLAFSAERARCVSPDVAGCHPDP